MKAGRWDPSTWASRRPFGIGEGRPNNYLEIVKAIRENRGSLRHAWRILNKGVCDGCALGTSGLHDWTIDGIHLCNVRLRLLRLNTMPGLDPSVLSDVSALRSKSGAALRALGRLPAPMVRRRGEPGFSPVGWDAALDLVADRIRATDPQRLGFYLTSRGMPNESYYAAQKAVRAIGTNSIDNSARVCHAPSTVALKEQIGAAATTCSYTDWMDADLVVFIGSNVANNQPVAMKYLYYARKRGTKVAVVNTYREPGMERYWVPSNLESALFGTKVTDRFFLVSPGGDAAFFTGALRHLVELGSVDSAWIEAHTTGFDAVVRSLDDQSWDELERASGSSRDEMLAFAQMVADAERAVLVWSMGVTQHTTGEDNVRAIVNLGLARGMVGRDGCGLMPIRGHSGVQGGAEMGAYATAFPGGLPVTAGNAAALSARWGFDVPASKGLTAPEMIDAAAEGNLDVLFSAGGNFLEVMPDPAYVDGALGRVPLRVHMDIVVSTQMLVDPADTVVLLPAATRYEIPGGVTETSTERRIIFSPEIPGPRPGDVRSEMDVLLEIARRARPERAAALAARTTQDVRTEIARDVPSYAGIESMTKAGDQLQMGGRHLCEDGRFPTPDGRARFIPVRVEARVVPEGSFVVTTRRGKQFNSMVHEAVDPLTGAGRDDVLIHADDVAALGLKDGDGIRLTSATGSYAGRVRVAEVRRGSIEVHWPESSALIDRHRRSPGAGIPDYSAVVTATRA